MNMSKKFKMELFQRRNTHTKLSLPAIYTFRWFIFALSVRQSFEILALAKIKNFNEAIRANISHPLGNKKKHQLLR